MEAVGAVGSIAGIASFGLQLAQLLQKQISEIRDAEERVNDLVSEVRATSNNLDQIKSLLLSNDASTKTPTLNHRFREDLQFLIQRCETIFRNVVTLLAKAGAGALSSVDGFLRPFRRNEKSKPDVDIKLKMEFVQLSASNKALWSFKRPKIEECIADLGRLKSELMLLLLIISLLKTAPISTENDGSLSIPATDDAITLVDDIYYTNQALSANQEEPNMNFPHSETIHVSEDHDASSREDTDDDDEDSFSNMVDATLPLYLSWPCSFTTNAPSLQRLVENGIIFEAYAIDMAGTTHEYAKLPLPPGELYEKVLESARSNEKSISEHFAKLPFSQQKIVEQTLLKIDPNSHSVSSSEPLATSVVVTLESRGPNRQNSALRKLKTLFRSDKAEVRSNCLKITLMRMLVDSEEEDPDLGEEKKEEEEEPANNRLGKHQADGMSELINQAFLHVEMVGSHVEDGHYDLTHVDGCQIILPCLWDATVQPGWSVQQHMWPMPERETKPEPPSPPPPPPDIEPLHEPLAPKHKERKPRAKPPTSRDFGSSVVVETISKPWAKGKPSSMFLLKPTNRLAPDVARIADYKHKGAEETGSLTDEIQEEAVPPSDNDKMAVAQHYLLKWTAEDGGAQKAVTKHSLTGWNTKDIWAQIGKRKGKKT